MPYIKKERRKALWGDSIKDRDDTMLNAGELNFRLTELIIEYIQKHGLSYQTLNDITGAMLECNAEFRRRIVVPYEVKKIKQNGDVYPKGFK
jgi:DNA polymerase III delta prime subunit